MPNPSVLIVSLSARALAQAARRGGYAVHAIDLFGDADTRAASVSAQAVAAAGEGFDRDALLAAAREVIASHLTGPVVCGSGFESGPELLGDLARLAPLCGNTVQTVRAVTQPSSLFPALLQQRIDFPQTVTSGAIPADGWLEKQIGGCGGGHSRLLGLGRLCRWGCGGRP